MRQQRAHAMRYAHLDNRRALCGLTNKAGETPLHAAAKIPHTGPRAASVLMVSASG
jgi:hypothetical protein